MSRVTQTHLDVQTGVVNSILRDGLHVETQGRNGYVGLDLYDGHGLVRTLTCGTKREVSDYLGAMLETFSILGREAA